MFKRGEKPSIQRINTLRSGLTEGEMLARRREREKKDIGCAIRSLESATGTVATDPEVDRRLSDMQTHTRRYVDRIWGQRRMTESTVNEWEFELETIFKMIQDFSRTQTELGRKLSEFQIRKVKLKLTELLRELAVSNQEVILIANVTDPKSPTEILSNHAAHIRLSGGQIVSLSDDGVIFNLHPDKSYSVLILSKKK